LKKYDFVISISTGEMKIEEIKTWIKEKINEKEP
jgi:hypothetical protein